MLIELRPRQPNDVVKRATRLSRLSALPVPVALVSIACAVVATTWSALTHSMLLYGDAQSHLNIARHVTDGLHPGLVQLGSDWLPLPHLLLVPLVAFTWMWHSGAAGAIVGGACFVYSAVRVYTLVDELTGSRVGAWCAFGIYVANFNLLYLQSTALTEPVLLAFLVGATFHLARWLRTRSVRSLAMAGLLTFCATLTRFDGWAFLVVASTIVIMWTGVGRRHPKEVQANALVFVTIGGYGVVLWFLYNLIIFHDPLYFIDSAATAQSQQAALSHVGQLLTKGDLLRSALTYGWAVVDVLGPAVAAAGAVCLIALAVARGLARRRTVAVLALLSAPVVFNVVSLWLGQSTLRVPQVRPYSMWNDRYAIMALPLAAVALGAVAGRWRKALPIVVAVAALGIAMMATSTPLTIKDGRVGISSAATTVGDPATADAYLGRNYRGGEVLADDTVASPFMFESGLDLKQFVTIGFEPWYDEALHAPASNVAWVVTVGHDSILADMTAHPQRFKLFHLVSSSGLVRLYERQGSGGRHAGGEGE